MIAGIAAAAPSARTQSYLEASGLIEPMHPAARAVAPARQRGGGSPVWSSIAVLCGLFYVAAGWGAVRDGWVRGSLLARISPTHIEATGTLRTDPATSRFGWFAEVGVSQVRWSGGSAGSRELVWLDGNGSVPSAQRGDRVWFAGLVEPANDPGFASSLLDRGISVEVRASSIERLGASSNPLIHAAQAFRAFVGRSIERLFPRSEAGLLLGLALGDAGHLDPSSARAFQATGLGHLLVVSGENGSSVGAWLHRQHGRQP
jgi:hypothetical protein